MNKDTSKKIFIKTFGCQMNEYDSNRLYDTLKKIGYKKTLNQDDAILFAFLDPSKRISSK